MALTKDEKEQIRAFVRTSEQDHAAIDKGARELEADPEKRAAWWRRWRHMQAKMNSSVG